jgi:hypothetical protein
MSNAFSGYGLFVKLGNNDGVVSPFSAETFTAIKEVQEVNFTGSKVDIVDVTHAQSPNARREYIATLIDDGDMDCTANFLPGDTTQTSLQTVYNNRQPRNWEVDLPNGLGKFTFSGLVTSLNRDLNFAKEAKLTFKVKITGQNVLTTS